MKILALDPGTTKSGAVWLSDDLTVDSCAILDNEDLLQFLTVEDSDVLAVEWIKAMGMPQSDDVIETVEWIGRFRERWGRRGPFVKITRREVKMYICGRMDAKDPNIRQSLIDMYPKTGGGKVPQIGIKAQPGPLFGMSSHCWSALAVGITYLHTKRQEAA